MDLQALVEAVRHLPPLVVWAVLALGALSEYVVPPVPGDTVVVAGSVLVGHFDWAWWPVYVAVTLGALVGSALDYGAGVWLGRHGRLDRLGPRSRRSVNELVGRFQRRGHWYLALNRFVPGVRALFFVAAGLAGLRLRMVLAWSAVSAMIWNGLLVVAGYAAGSHIELLERWFHRYNRIMWVVIGVILLVVALRIVRSLRRELPGTADASPSEPEASAPSDPPDEKPDERKRQ